MTELSTETTAPTEAPDAWDRGAAWLAEHGALPALAVLTVVVAVMYSGVFAGELAGDDLTFHMAEASRLADCLRDGDWDLWNPSANGGFASAYYYQVLPQLASALPAAIFGHFLFWFQLSIFVPLVLAPVAAYRGARLIGASPWQAVAAALAVSFISGASRWGTGADGTFQVGLYTQTWALAAFPLALGHGVRWLVDRRGLAPAIAWGTFCGLCHPFAGVSLGVALATGVVAHAAASAIAPVARWAKFVAIGLCTLGAIENLARALISWELYPMVPALLCLALGERMFWDVRRRVPVERPRVREVLRGEGVRLAILGAALLVASLPGWLTVLVDYAGFGGFPHRVADEVGPGYQGLLDWQAHGMILDNARPMILTWTIPVVVVGARDAFMRWLWAPAVTFAALLAIGPRLGKTADDLLPAVRFLGALQIVLAVAVGVGLVAIGRRLWLAPRDSRTGIALRYAMFAGLVLAAVGASLALALADASNPLLDILWKLTAQQIDSLVVLRAIGIGLFLGGLAVGARPAWRALGTEYGIRTGLAAVAAALVVLVTVQGSRALSSRVRVFGEANHRSELVEVAEILEHQPGGRKQVANGAENHWWNLLTYVYGRRPALLQMGGGGLQASPNYDFMWSVRDLRKLAWVYDTPYLVFQTANAASQPEGQTIERTASYEIRRLPAPGLVSPVQVTGVLPADKKEARAAAIAWLKTDVPYADHVLAYAGYGQPGDEPAAKVVRAGRQRSPGDLADIYAEVAVQKPSTFVARESWHPRWHAYIDGAEVPVRRVTPDFPAIDVPAGTHLLQFRFERPWWAHAAWLAWPAITLAAWLALRPRRRAKLPAARALPPRDTATA